MAKTIVENCLCLSHKFSQQCLISSNHCATAIITTPSDLDKMYFKTDRSIQLDSGNRGVGRIWRKGGSSGGKITMRKARAKFWATPT